MADDHWLLMKQNQWETDLQKEVLIEIEDLHEGFNIDKKPRPSMERRGFVYVDYLKKHGLCARDGLIFFQSLQFFERYFLLFHKMSVFVSFSRINGNNRQIVLHDDLVDMQTFAGRRTFQFLMF